MADSGNQAAPVVAGLAVGIGFIILFAVFVTNPNSHLDEQSNDSLITIAETNDVLDYGASSSPTFIRAVIGVNNTVTWLNTNETSITLEGVGDGYYPTKYILNTTIDPGESFSFTFDEPGIYYYNIKDAYRGGNVFVTTWLLEKARLTPETDSILHDKSPEEVARIVIKAVDPTDEIASIWLNNSFLTSYTTEKEGYVLMPALQCTLCYQYDPIEYIGAIPDSAKYPNATSKMDFVENFMNEVGYTMDGSELVEIEDYDDSARIYIYQKVNNEFAIPTPGAYFSFMDDDDSLIIELARWYESKDLSNYKFGLSADNAARVAWNYMNQEVRTDERIAKYQYKTEGPGPVHIDIVDDKVMYLVPLYYETTNPEYYDDKDHCWRPAYQFFWVMVDASTGRVIHWYPEGCA